jgi:hypothetical protein
VNKRIFLLGLVLVFCGCSISGPGQLYTNITLPYTRDFNRTPVGGKQCVLKEHRVREPVSGYGVTVEWSSDRIQAAANKAGITEISCIDVQTVSFLLGIYTRRKLIIYGD